MQNKIEIPWYKIKDIGLLTVEEAEKLPKDILKFSNWWWLSSPGVLNFSVAYVDDNGIANARGLAVYFIFSVRPILICDNIDSFGLKLGDKVSAFGKEWQYIGDDRILLYGEPLTEMEFRDADEQTPGLNDYEKSDVKKYLDDWLDRDVFNEYPISTYSITFYENKTPLETKQTDHKEEIAEIIANYLNNNLDNVDFVELYNIDNENLVKLPVDKLID